ncbi:MAG: DUF2339 domain-containing protein, partial [Hyphomonadaceae bacterium]
MELELLATVGLAAFLVCGGVVLLVVSFRRTVQLRRALIHAIHRIERLEAGLPPHQLSAPSPDLIREALAAQAAHETPALQSAAPALAPEPAAREEAPFATLDQLAAEAPPDRVDPPHLGVLSAGAGLAVFAALAAAHTGALSAIGGMSVAFGIGAAVLLVSEWRLRVAGATLAENWKPHAAAVTALLGFALLFATILFGRWALEAAPPLASVHGVFALGFGAALLSLRHGQSLIAFALLCAAIAPSLSPIGAVSGVGHYLPLLALCALIMALSRRRGATPSLWWQAWGAAAVALFWGVNAALIRTEPINIAASGLYLASLAALGFGYAWQSGGAPLAFPRFWKAAWSEPAWLGHFMAGAASGALFVLTASFAAPAPYLAAGLCALAAIGVAAGALRAGLWLAPAIAALTCAAAIALWPAVGATPDAPGLLVLGLSLALLFALGGWLMMARADDPRPGAYVAALAPILIFAAAYARISGFGAPVLWASAAFMIAVINVASYERTKTMKRDAAAPFAAGAALAFTAALAALIAAPYQALALALALPLAGLVNRWRDETGLRVAASVLCVLLFLRLLVPQFFIASADPPGRLLLLFAASAASCFLAAQTFLGGRRRADIAPGHYCLTLSMVLTAACVTLLARHIATSGAIGAPYASLAELGVNTLAWLGLAFGLAWRFGTRPRP